MFVVDALRLLPTIRNSNLLPVKAKGEVRFRSLVSFGTYDRFAIAYGCVSTSGLISCSPLRSFSRMISSSSPIQMETTAGGASSAPSR